MTDHTSFVRKLVRKLIDKQLLVVTGKGGVGKSTIAAALAAEAARGGRRVLLASHTLFPAEDLKLLHAGHVATEHIVRQLLVPESFQALRLIGGLTYWGMRVGTHWITRLPQALGMSFPCLENHFFVLKARPPCS